MKTLLLNLSHTQSPPCLLSLVDSLEFLSSKSSFSVIVHVSLVSNLDWFWSSKRQNNCSHISRWTLTGLKQLSFTWFSINHVLVSNLIIRIFWGALLSLFLSGGMIFWGAFIIHLSISIALYVIISSYWDILLEI